MPRETESQRIVREQRELIARLNADRDARLTTRQQNDMKMKGAPPRPVAAATPAPNRPAVTSRAALGVHGNRVRQLDEMEARYTGKPPKR